MVNALRAAAGLLVTRFKYLDSVPWACSRADTQEGAAIVLDQIDSAPDSAHDVLTLDFRDKFRGDLEVRRAGGPASPAPSDEVAAINLASLDESAGEGYHRGTNTERIRCPSAKSPYIMQSTRFQENLVQVRGVLQKHKATARDVLRFDWVHYKRILQVLPRLFWVNVKLSPRHFLNASITWTTIRWQSGPRS